MGASVFLLLYVGTWVTLSICDISGKYGTNLILRNVSSAGSGMMQAFHPVRHSQRLDIAT